jgi:hypothetical protein
MTLDVKKTLIKYYFASFPEPHLQDLKKKPHFFEQLEIIRQTGKTFKVSDCFEKL